MISRRKFLNHIVPVSNLRVITALLLVIASFALHAQSAKCVVTYTFDDGLADQYTVAYPMFRKAGLPATFFIIGSKVGDPNGLKNSAERNTPLMTWEQIRDMSTNGMEIASHGWAHAKYAKLNRDEILEDIRRNQVALKENAGVDCVSFASPFNTKKGADGSDIEALAKETGLRAMRMKQRGAGSKMTADQMNELVESAKKKGEWLVFMIHGMARGYDAWENPEELEKHLAWVKEQKDVRVLSFAAAANVAAGPLKIALTFDDGFEHHLTQVAPLLEKRGYRGAFSLVTDIVGKKEGRLTWDQVRELKARGHDVFAHSCSHPNLTKLCGEGRKDEARRQIVESAEKIKAETGEMPKVFCFPFNSARHVCGMVREAGMIPMQAKRVNFGDGTWKGGNADVNAHIDRLVASGAKADALMIHGIGKETGAHRPFKDVAHFERFLEELGERESKGDIKVVPYMEIAEEVAPDK